LGGGARKGVVDTANEDILHADLLIQHIDDSESILIQRLIGRVVADDIYMGPRSKIYILCKPLTFEWVNQSALWIGH